MSTPAKVAEWLRNNDGNLPDAYKATGYNGPPLKVKEGSLSGDRSKIRLSPRGDNGDSSRRRALQLNPPKTKEEQNRNRRQNYKRSSLRKQGKNVVIDHKHDLNLLSQTVEGMSPEQAKSHIKRLEQSYGPLGNRPDNRKIVGARFNELKNQDSKALQRHLSRLANKAVVGRPMFASVAGALLGYLPEIDELTGGHINGAINGAMNNVKDQVQKSAEFYTNFLADRQSKGYDLHF